MSNQVTLGGDRLGSGKKIKVDLHGYERSTHDLGFIWRSTMAPGTLVPFLCEVALPGDTFDIDLDLDIKTHPTIGPLFGSYKAQIDIFQAPVRLYQAQLHNNAIGIGLNMANIKLPVMRLVAPKYSAEPNDLDNAQINPSSILSYLGIRGIGIVTDPVSEIAGRYFNAIPYLAYVEIYKQYYSNKQEGNGYVIHTPAPAANDETVDNIQVWPLGAGSPDLLLEYPDYTGVSITVGTQIIVNWTGTEASGILINTNTGQYRLDDLFLNKTTGAGTTTYTDYNWGTYGNMILENWNYNGQGNVPQLQPQVTSFPLDNIDTMRKRILADAMSTDRFEINDVDISPYTWIALDGTAFNTSLTYSQEGLLLKTYQSDMFNNWLKTEWIDGAGGINEVTAIDTSGGSFNIDTLIISKKVYNMLNRIAVSGGTYQDWLMAVYDQEQMWSAESPIYHGGLIKELIFQEVVSNSSSNTGEQSQPLGTLAGKGVMGKKHKGGSVTIKVNEHSYIIGIVSLTPRIDYSQGNKWHTTAIMTMDDFHKPQLDEIGFQELITERMAWWTTEFDVSGEWVQKSAGKQPAWLNYMTNVNEVRGNFAIESNEMFMTLNRRYEHTGTIPEIEDLTTYIDPSKFNFIFAQTALDSQNFWTQIAADITARRKMSNKVMPNL